MQKDFKKGLIKFITRTLPTGLDEPVPLGRPLPAFPLGSVPPDHPPRPAFRSMTSEPAARREMSRVASELLSCRAGFESLSRAVSLAQGAEVVSCALDQAAGEDAPVQLDGEEVKHVKGETKEEEEKNFVLHLLQRNGVFLKLTFSHCELVMIMFPRFAARFILDFKRVLTMICNLPLPRRPPF